MSSQLNAPSPAPSGGPLGPPSDLSRDYGVTRVALLVRDPQWMHAYWEVASGSWEEVERLHGGHARRSGRPVLRMYSSRGTEKNFFDIDVQMEARSWYIFSPLRGGAWFVQLGLLLPDGRFIVLATSNEVHLPNGAVSDVMEEKWGLLKAEWERLFELSGGGRLGAGSLEVTRMLAQRWEFLKSLSSWAGSPAGSSWAGPRGRKNFWLVADAELVVHGATEPTARVKVQGRDVKLNPDGTFTLRFKFPDGTLQVPILAVNADGDMSESIDFTFVRETRREDKP